MTAMMHSSGHPHMIMSANEEIDAMLILHTLIACNCSQLIGQFDILCTCHQRPVLDKRLQQLTFGTLQCVRAMTISTRCSPFGSRSSFESWMAVSFIG